METFAGISGRIKSEWVETLNRNDWKDYAGIRTISGDLGQKGLIDDLITLIAPLYKPTSRNIIVGINLLTAYLSKKNYQDGLKLLQQLKKLKRFDFNEKLNYFDVEFNRIKQGSH